MRRSVLGGLSAAAVLAVTASGAWAQLADRIAEDIKNGVPVIGADVGVAMPISTFRQTADVGAAIAPFGGYQIADPALDGFTVTPILQPQFAGFPAGCCGDTLASITSVSAGARFSLLDADSEAYFGAQGGYYWYTNGPLEHHSGNGFNVEGGYNYDFWRGTALGVFLRYDNANMHASLTSNSDTTEFVTAGLEVRYRFLPPPPPAPPPAIAAAAAPAPTPVVKKKIVLRGVNFDFNKYNIRPDAAPILDEAAKTLQESGEINIAVNGYTDSIGSDAYNDALSLRRATAVMQYLEAHGVSGSRMTVKGFGRADPVASNATAEARAQNRRVELIVNQ